MNEINSTDKVNSHPRFKKGEQVLFAFIYGEHTSSYTGEPRQGMIDSIEYIPSRDLYLYTIIYQRTATSCMYHRMVLGEHMVFKLNERDKCLAKINEFVRKV